MARAHRLGQLPKGHRVHPVIEPEVREDVDELLAEHPRGLVSPGGAAKMLGVRRQTVESLLARKRIQVFYGPDLAEKVGPFVRRGPRWKLIPVTEVERYAVQKGHQVHYLDRSHRPSGE